MLVKREGQPILRNSFIYVEIQNIMGKEFLRITKLLMFKRF